MGSLRDHRQPATPLLGREVAQVPACEQDAACRAVPEAQQELDQGGLAGAAGTDDGDLRARRQIKADAIQRRRQVGGIAEAEVVNPERQLARRRQREWRSVVAHRRLGIYDLKQPLACLQALVQVLQSGRKRENSLEARYHGHGKKCQVDPIEPAGPHEQDGQCQHG